MPDYKLYIMLNTYSLTDEERESIFKKASKNHATVLWLYANENFVAIHTSFSGKRRINFKKKCLPFEVYEKKYYGKNVDFIDIDMQLGETKMFYLGRE